MPEEAINHANLMQNGWIEVICGCMFSGKSSEGAKRISKELLAKNRELKIFIPVESRREVTLTQNGEKVNTAGKMISRTGKMFEAIEFPKDQPEIILEHIDNAERKPTTVVIEEAHFCAPSLVDICKKLAEEYKLRVIVIGLDQTFEDKGFGPIPALMVEAEFVSKELAVCVNCGSQNASKSWLDPRAREQLQGDVLIGDEQYVALCRHCKKSMQSN